MSRFPDGLALVRDDARPVLLRLGMLRNLSCSSFRVNDGRRLPGLKPRGLLDAGFEPIAAGLPLGRDTPGEPAPRCPLFPGVRFALPVRLGPVWAGAERFRPESVRADFEGEPVGRWRIELGDRVEPELEPADRSDFGRSDGNTDAPRFDDDREDDLGEDDCLRIDERDDDGFDDDGRDTLGFTNEGRDDDGFENVGRDEEDRAVDGRGEDRENFGRDDDGREVDGFENDGRDDEREEERGADRENDGRDEDDPRLFDEFELRLFDEEELEGRRDPDDRDFDDDLDAFDFPLDPRPACAELQETVSNRAVPISSVMSEADLVKRFGACDVVVIGSVLQRGADRPDEGRGLVWRTQQTRK